MFLKKSNFYFLNNCENHCFTLLKVVRQRFLREVGTFMFSGIRFPQDAATHYRPPNYWQLYVQTGLEQQF